MKEREEEMEKSLAVVVGGRQVPRGSAGETEGRGALKGGAAPLPRVRL